MRIHLDGVDQELERCLECGALILDVDVAQHVDWHAAEHRFVHQAVAAGPGGVDR